MSADNKHGHHHDHSHPHPFQPDDDAGPPSEHMLLVRALRELLIEKGVYTADEERRTIERMDARSPAGGAKMVARAWVDPAYREAPAGRRHAPQPRNWVSRSGRPD